MDPNAALEELRSLAAKLADQDVEDPQTLEDLEQDAARMAELFQGLDEWITKGGFLPSTWKRS